jgi:phage shock protein A
MWTVVQDKVNRMMGMEDPRENIDLSFEKQQIMLDDVRRSVAQFVVYRERIELQREKLQLRMERLEAQARESLSANREDLARMALGKRAVFQAQADSLDRQIADLKEQHQIADGSREPIGDKAGGISGQEGGDQG